MKNGLLLALTVLLLSSKLYASKFEVRWEKGSKKILMDRDNSQAEYNGSSSQYRFYVADTLTNDTVQLRLYQDDYISGNYFSEYSVYFSHDYIKVKHGDLKDIFTLDGNILFRSAHYETYNDEYNTITAWLCGGVWILANTKGDTLFYDRERTRILDMNYMPNISNKIFAAKILSLEKGKVCYGYMNQKGEWILPAIYDEAEEFKNNVALVEMDGRKFRIDDSGREIK